MSASSMPTCGCAGLVLSIFTTSTGLPSPPAHPVNGLTFFGFGFGLGVGVGVADGVGDGVDAALLSPDEHAARMPALSTAAVTAAKVRTARRRRLTRW